MKTEQSSNFYDTHGETFKKAYSAAYNYVVNRESKKAASFQLKDREFLSANLMNFMPSIKPENYDDIYYNLLTNHLLSGNSFNYANLDSMQYMRVEGNTEFLIPNAPRKPTIFCTYHLGGYRAIFAMLIKAGYPLALVVDKKTHNNQKELISNITQKLNSHHGTDIKVKILEAESTEIGKNMALALASGYSILIFLDGNTGVGGLYNRTEKQLKLKFLEQEIYSRTGIATLSYAMRVPIIPIISYYQTINEVEVPLYCAAEPIVPTKAIPQNEFVEKTTACLYQFLEDYLFKYPNQWESWFYFHKFLALDNVKNDDDNAITETLPLTLRFNNRQYGIFKLNDEAYLLDKKTYKAFPLSADLFEKLQQIVKKESILTQPLIEAFSTDWVNQLYKKNILVP